MPSRQNHQGDKRSREEEAMAPNVSENTLVHARRDEPSRQEWRVRPLRAAQICSALANKANTPREKAYWFAQQAWGLSLVSSRTKELERAVLDCIAHDISCAKQEAGNVALQSEYPIYTAMLCSKLAAHYEKMGDKQLSAYWKGQNARPLDVLDNQPGVSHCVKAFVAEHPRLALADVQQLHLQAAFPRYCQRIAEALALLPNPPLEVGRLKGLEAFCYSRLGSQYRSFTTSCAKIYVTEMTDAAIIEALDDQLLEQHPDYVLILSNLLFESLEDHYKSLWLGRSARCLILLDNRQAFTAVVSQYVQKWPERALLEAKDLINQTAYPTLCIEIYNLLKINRPHDPRLFDFLRNEAQLVARYAQSDAHLTLCIRQMYELDCDAALCELNKTTDYSDNPRYYRELARCGAEVQLSLMKQKEAFCLGLMEGTDPSKLTPCVIEFVKFAKGLAERHAISPKMQDQNPLYCMVLCAVLSEKIDTTNRSDKDLLAHYARLKIHEARSMVLLHDSSKVRQIALCIGKACEIDLGAVKQYLNTLPTNEHPDMVSFNRQIQDRVERIPTPRSQNSLFNNQPTLEGILPPNHLTPPSWNDVRA